MVSRMLWKLSDIPLKYHLPLMYLSNDKRVYLTRNCANDISKISCLLTGEFAQPVDRLGMNMENKYKAERLWVG